LKATRLVPLLISVALLLLGVLLGDYNLAAVLVRFVCTSCVGIG